MEIRLGNITVNDFSFGTKEELLEKLGSIKKPGTRPKYILSFFDVPNSEAVLRDKKVELYNESSMYVKALECVRDSIMQDMIEHADNGNSLMPILYRSNSKDMDHKTVEYYYIKGIGYVKLQSKKLK